MSKEIFKVNSFKRSFSGLIDSIDFLFFVPAGAILLARLISADWYGNIFKVFVKENFDFIVLFVFSWLCICFAIMLFSFFNTKNLEDKSYSFGILLGIPVNFILAKYSLAMLD